MKTQKAIYWISTSLLCALLLYSATFYFTDPAAAKGFFKFFNYPTYIVIPLAVAKVLAVLMILWRKSSWLTEWAYAGVFFDFVLAFFAHQQANDAGTLLPLLGLVFLLLSYFFGKEVRYSFF